jgi:hypothetical protein
MTPAADCAKAAKGKTSAITAQRRKTMDGFMGGRMGGLVLE